MITEKMTGNYEELIESNCYGELLATIASDFNMFYFKKIFQSILTIHDTEGHINYDVLELRNRFKNEMLTALRNLLSDQDYNIITKYI